MRAAGQKRRSRKQGLGVYLQKRKATLQFCAFFLFGLTAASIFCVGDSTAAKTIAAIVQNSLRLSAQQSLTVLWLKLSAQNLCLAAYFYFCGNCTKGALPAALVPLGFGLALGCRLTVLLAVYGWTALRYCLPAVILPKLVKLLLLAGMYNAALRSSRGVLSPQTGENVGQGGSAGLFYLAALGAQALLESWLIGIS